MTAVIANKCNRDLALPVIMAENTRIQEIRDREAEIKRLEALVRLFVCLSVGLFGVE